MIAFRTRRSSRAFVPALIFGIAAFLPPARAQAPDRSTPPLPGPPAQLHLPPIEHLSLTNGLHVLVLEKHEVPLVQIDLLIKAGAAMDPAGKGGLASMTAALLTAGAGGRDALALADAIDFLGATLSANAGYHSLAIELHTPLSKLDSALSVMADVALRPSFPAAELERTRKERLTSLLQWRDEPRRLASVVFDRALYGENNPYGAPLIGDAVSLGTLQVQDVRRFYGTYAHPNNAVLIVVGDVTPSSLLPRLERAFGSWLPAEVPAISPPPATQVRTRSVILVDKPGAAQSDIRIGRIGAPRLTDDYYALVVMNTVLGGSFTSRLNQNLREKHGYTYGAGSRFDFRLEPGPFLAGAAVQTDVTDKALAEFMKELRGITEPIGDAEIDRAKNYVALSFPRDFQTVADVAQQLEQLAFYRLPDDYFNNYVGQILAVTKADVDRVAKKYIDPAGLVIVVVGDRKKIEKGIEALNLGPVSFMTVNDVMGNPPAAPGADRQGRTEEQK